MLTVGERIKKRRKFLNMSVDSVAAKLKKNRATIYRYESNEIEKMPITVLEPIAQVLQTTPSYLMGWTNNPNIEDERTIGKKLSEIMKELPHGEHQNMYEEILEYVKMRVKLENSRRNQNGKL